MWKYIWKYIHIPYLYPLFPLLNWWMVDSHEFKIPMSPKKNFGNRKFCDVSITQNALLSLRSSISLK